MGIAKKEEPGTAKKKAQTGDRVDAVYVGEVYDINGETGRELGWPPKLYRVRELLTENGDESVLASPVTDPRDLKKFSLWPFVRDARRQANAKAEAVSP